jgi:diguanylate cyclase (GGDEF)-like protein/PAS domain S-box-containing protein
MNPLAEQTVKTLERGKRRAESLLRAILQTIPDLVWLKDEAGVYLACNRMFERLYGAAEADIIGKTDYDFVNRELADSFREHDLMAMQADKIDITERWITFADDGHRIYVETIKSAMYDDKGNLIGVLGIARDMTERRADTARINRLTQLYAALSQCNQAIVRSSSEAELFPQICLDAVRFGGMKMAWIGMLDEASGQVKPATFYGAGSEYLQDIDISVDADLPSGRGPTGMAIRENQPFWCQDFLHDPATKAWHERAARFGWGSSASLPLHRNGIPVGAFTLYSAEVNAFDEAARDLLVEMAMDISFALDNFAREVERKRLELQSGNERSVLELLARGESLPALLSHLAGSYEAMYPGMLCSVLLLSQDGRHLVHGAAPSLPAAYCKAIDGTAIGENTGSCGTAACTRKTVIVTDIAHDPLWEDYKELALENGLAACWSVPILSTQGQVLGTFALYYSAPRSPQAAEMAALERGAHLASLAIERAQSEARIVKLANFDTLTGLPNQMLLKDRIAHAMSMSQRGAAQMAVLFLDLDHFKNINDTLGHRIGDELLIQLAARLKALLREEDTLSRLGGDEFILVLTAINADGAAHVAEKVLATVAQAYHIDQFELVVTPSVGIAMYPSDGTDFDRLYQSADVAMYRAKMDGRNCFRFYTAEMQERSARRLQLENALRHALARKQFQLHYQPQISMQDGRVTGAEALLRWQHPELGMVSPAEFIPVAEESGLILSIGEWVLRTAVQQAKRWMDSGQTAITIAVNLSAVQFRQANLPELVVQILEEANLPPQYIELELTESVAMEVPLAAIAVMDELYARGIRMSIDDFGTGYSSLSYLRKFKINKLKIDQSFVCNITEDTESHAIVTAIITLAGSLGFQTIAEGVETAGQLEFLRLKGCNEAQGYYFSKPLDALQFEMFMRDRAAG